MARHLNDDVADRLDEIAALLDTQAASPFRTRAYRQAAATLRGLAVPVSQILSTEGTAGLGPRRPARTHHGVRPEAARGSPGHADGSPRAGPRGIAPRRLNPTGAAWLPILHAERGGRQYTALFSNTARAHRFGKTGDWVILYCDDGSREHQWTVITAGFGPLSGRRIVTGREAECSALFDAAP